MASPAAYLRRVMLNAHLRQAGRRRISTVDVELADTVAAGERWELDEDLWAWLATLPRQQRAVLVLRYYEDLPDDQIAELVGCSPTTVRSHASRGLATLRTLLTPRDVP